MPPGGKKPLTTEARVRTGTRKADLTTSGADEGSLVHLGPERSSFSLGVGAHDFNPSARKAETFRSRSSRPAWCIKLSSGLPTKDYIVRPLSQEQATKVGLIFNAFSSILEQRDGCESIENAHFKKK